MLREGGERGVQPVVEAARAQAVGDLAQLGDGGAQLGDGLVDQAVHVGRAVVEVALGEPQGHAERDEPLLRAVVQVALEPAALLVAGLDQPGPARLDLAQRRGELQAQAHDLDERRGRRGDLAQELGRQRREAGTSAPIGAPPMTTGTDPRGSSARAGLVDEPAPPGIT